MSDIRQCNKCGRSGPEFDECDGLSGEILRQYHRLTATWGFHSSGKDLSFDVWYLCRKCVVELLDRMDPTCSLCCKRVSLVMAELDVANRDCIHQSVEEALAYYKENRLVGCVRANIFGHPVCELCYERLIASFKEPIDIGRYDPGAPMIGKETEETVEDFEKWNGDRVARSLGLSPSEMVLYHMENEDGNSTDE